MENYALKPKEVECFSYGGCTDVIMRQYIRQVEQQNGSPEGSGEASQMIWECEEWQFRQPGILTPEEVKADWNRYWGYTPPKPDEGKGEDDFVTYGELRKAITEGVNSL